MRGEEAAEWKARWRPRVSHEEVRRCKQAYLSLRQHLKPRTHPHSQQQDRGLTVQRHKMPWKARF